MNGDGNEDGSAGGAKEVRVVVEGELIGNDARIDLGRKFLEMFGSMLDLESALDVFEFVRAGGHATERNGAGCPVAVGEAAGFGGPADLFGKARPCSWNMSKSVFFARIAGDVIFARARGINKLDFDIFSDSFQVAIAPLLPSVANGIPSTLLKGTLVSAASGMRVDLVGWTPDDIDAATVGFPARNAGSEVFVGVGQAAIVLFSEGVGGRFRVGIAVVPENFDELLALLVRGKFAKGAAFLLGDDVGDLILDPVFVRITEFFGESLLTLLEFLGGQRLGGIFLGRRLFLRDRESGPQQAG